MIVQVFLVAIASFLATASGAYCHGKPNPNATGNTNEIYSGDPTFLASTQNGELYMAGPENYQFYLLHLWGASAYEAGFAHGTLLKQPITTMVSEVWSYMMEQVTEDLTFLPEWLSDLIADVGLDFALDVLINITEPFTDPTIYDELAGISDGAGIDVQTLKRIHLIGELTQGSCSMLGIRNSALDPKLYNNNGLVTARMLDWVTDSVFQQYSTVVVYHSPSDSQNSYINVGFAGWAGVLTGVNSEGMSIHEIGVSFPDPDYFGNTSFVGTPFVFLLKSILAYDTTAQATVQRMQNTNRTCDLLLGVGDAKSNDFVGFTYSATQLGVWDLAKNSTIAPFNNTWHQPIQDVLYWAMDFLCPGYSLPMQDTLQKYPSQLSPQLLINSVIPVVQSGDLHIAVSDLSNKMLYVSFMNGFQNVTTDTPTYAYDRIFTALNITAEISRPMPSL